MSSISDLGTGGVLNQLQNGTKHVIAYYNLTISIVIVPPTAMHKNRSSIKTRKVIHHFTP